MIGILRIAIDDLILIRVSVWFCWVSFAGGKGGEEAEGDIIINDLCHIYTLISLA